MSEIDKFRKQIETLKPRDTEITLLTHELRAYEFENPGEDGIQEIKRRLSQKLSKFKMDLKASDHSVQADRELLNALSNAQDLLSTEGREEDDLVRELPTLPHPVAAKLARGSVSRTFQEPEKPITIKQDLEECDRILRKYREQINQVYDNNILNAPSEVQGLLSTLNIQQSKVDKLLTVNNPSPAEIGEMVAIIKDRFKLYIEKMQINPKKKSLSQRLSMSAAGGKPEAEKQAELILSDIVARFMSEAQLSLDPIELRRKPKVPERTSLIMRNKTSEIINKPRQSLLSDVDARVKDLKTKINALDLYQSTNLEKSILQLATDLAYLKKNSPKNAEITDLSKMFEAKLEGLKAQAKGNAENHSKLEGEIKKLMTNLDAEMEAGSFGDDTAKKIIEGEDKGILRELKKATTDPAFHQVLGRMEVDLSAPLWGTNIEVRLVPVISQLEAFMGVGLREVREETTKILEGKVDVKLQCQMMIKEYMNLIKGEMSKLSPKSKKIELYNNLDELNEKLTNKQNTSLETVRGFQQLMDDFIYKMEDTEKNRKVAGLLLFQTSDLSKEIRDEFNKDRVLIRGMESRMQGSFQDQDETKAKKALQEAQGPKLKR